jgi:hypothetical protein
MSHGNNQQNFLISISSHLITMTSKLPCHDIDQSNAIAAKSKVKTLEISLSP